MSFRFSPSGNEPADPWFRVGTVEVTTTVLVVAVGAITLVLDAFTGRAFSGWTFLLPDAVFGGEVWRLVTWPLANTISLWTALSLFLLWYFGTDLESVIGRSAMARMLIGFAVVLTVVHMAFGVLDPSRLYLAGVDMVEFLVLLTWIGEYPFRRFLFNIPAWVFGLVIVVLQVLGLIADRGLWALLALVVSLALGALVARSVGLLSEQTWLPSMRPRPRRPRAPRRTFSSDRPTVVSGPWAEHPSNGSPRARDDARLDELLDKIHEQGIDSLSSKERKELMELRERRSRG